MTEVQFSLSVPLSTSGHHLLHGSCAWQGRPGEGGIVGSLSTHGLCLPLLRGHGHHLAAAREQDQALIQGKQLSLTAGGTHPREAMILTLLQETTLPLWAPAGLGVRSEVLAGQTQGHVSQAQTAAEKGRPLARGWGSALASCKLFISKCLPWWIVCRYQASEMTRASAGLESSNNKIVQQAQK